MTLAQLQAKRETLLKSLGMASIEHDGNAIRYNSDENKLASLRAIDAEIAALQNPQSRQFTIQTKRGI